MKEGAYCRVDVDGKGPLHEFKVLCNMTNSKDAVTIVNHTTSGRQVKIMHEAYTFMHSAQSWAHKLDYGVDFKSLRALIDESDHCRQYVEFNCINTKFLTSRETNCRVHIGLLKMASNTTIGVGRSSEGLLVLAARHSRVMIRRRRVIVIQEMGFGGRTRVCIVVTDLVMDWILLL